jgi:hypothetical protein
VVDRIVTVPFSAIKDVQDGMTVHKQLKESPFYTLERTVHYTQLLFGHNQTGLPQTKTRAVTVGVDKTQSQTFQFETAISVGAEVGVSFLTGTVSASATVTIGFETSKSVTEMKSTTIVDTLKIDAGCAAASWALTYSLQLFRTDKEKTAVGKPLAFNNNGSFVDSEFRPLKGEATETELQVTA